MRSALLVALLFLAALTVSAQAECDGSRLFTEKTCAGDDLNGQEKELVRIVNDYRAQNQLAPVPVSNALAKLANRHLIDLNLNLRYLTHGWSNCPYDVKVESSWGCVFDSPQRLATGYKGSGYENLYRTAGANATPALALEAWKKSPMHNALILNLDVWKDRKFDAFGVAISGNYAALWFGSNDDGATSPTKSSRGLEVSFEKAVEGLTELLQIAKESSVGGSEKWSGRSADRTIQLDLYGSESDIAETTMAFSVKLPKTGQLPPQSRAALSQFLKNVVEKWPDREQWLTATLQKLVKTPKLVQTLNIGKRSIEMRANPNGTVTVLVKPSTRPVAKEI